MAKSTAIAAVVKGLSDFKTQFVAALARPANSAKMADTADTLENQSPLVVQNLLTAEVTKHINKLGVNIHKDSPTTLGSYTKSEYDAKLDLLLDTVSGVPFSFYGDREFLPPDITGSFESGSNTTIYGRWALMMEDNGTLMALRPGTDGDSAGVYYSYLRNADTVTTVDDLIMSNTRYSPAYFPSGQIASAILASSQDIIIGILVDATTYVRTGYFISLTNNTMDMSKHTGVVVPLGDIINPTLGGDATSVIMGCPVAYIKNSVVNILIDLDSEGKHGYRVYQISVANVNAGSWTGVTQVKGWTINRGTAGTITSDDMLLFDTLSAIINITGDPTNYRWPNSGTTCTFPLVSSAGRVSVLRQFWLQATPVDLKAAELGSVYLIGFDIPDSKVIDMSAFYNSKPTLNYTSPNALTITGGAAAITGSGSGTVVDWTQGQSINSYYTTKNNQMWLTATTTYVTNRTLYRFQFPDGSDPLATFFQTKVSQVIGDSVFGSFGSALTYSIQSHGVIGDGVMTAVNPGRRSDGARMNYAVRATIEGDPTYQYSSVTGNYAFKGFIPTINRNSFYDLGKAENLCLDCLNESDSTQYRVSQARFNQGSIGTRIATINTDLSSSGTVSCPQAVLDSLTSQMNALLASKSISLYPYANSGVSGSAPQLLELVVPQVYTDMPAFVHGGYIRSDQVAYQFVCSVTFTGTRDNITGATLTAASYVEAKITVSVDSPGLYAHYGSSGNCAIRRVTNGFMVGLMSTTRFRLVGDDQGVQALLQYTGGAWTFNQGGWWTYWSTAPSGWFNFPTRGLYFSQCSENQHGAIDDGTKILGIQVATTALVSTTLDTLYGNLSDSTKTIILASQKTVSAWTVYFADYAPCMLDGSYVVINPLTYNLNSSSDGNKTFYVWVVKKSGVISYQIVDSNPAAPVADSALYLGYFTTGDIGLLLVSCEKKVAVGGYVLARTSQGTAIPLTSGTPNAYGRLNWK
jgi:hypothetical protein